MTSPDGPTVDDWLRRANQDLTDIVADALDTEAILAQLKRQAFTTAGTPTDTSFDVLEATHATADGGPAPIDAPAGRPPAQAVPIPAVRQPPNQLPRDIPRVVGRIDTMRQLDELLATPGSHTAIVALDGGPGIGKTTVAIHWAHRHRHRFDDGVLYADLNGYGPGTPTSPATVLATFLDALGIPHDHVPRDIGERASLLRHELTGKRILVVLDNVRVSAQVRPLLPVISPNPVLITSRQKLSALAYRDGVHCITVPTLLLDEAIALLQLHIGHDRVANDLPALHDLAALCSRTPLALRVAAEHLAARPHVPVPELVRDLRNQHRLLDVNAEEDHESTGLRTVFDWSTNTLPPDADHLFCLLGLHPSTQLSTSAAAALVDWPLARTQQALDVLVGAHLARPQGPDSYRLHALTHLYASDRARRLFTQQDCRQAVHRQVDWYLATAAAAVSKISPQRRPMPPLTLQTSIQPRTFDSDHDALRWCIQERPQVLAVVRMAIQYHFHDHVWRLIGTFDDIFNRFGDPHVTADIYRAALDSARHSGSRFAEACIQNSIGTITFYVGEYETAAHSYSQALAITREINDQIGESASLFNIGTTLAEQGSYAKSVECYRQSLAIAERVDDKDGQARVHHRLGELHQRWERPDDAERFFRRSLALRIELNDFRNQAITLIRLGELRIETDPMQAIQYCDESLMISDTYDHRTAAQALAIRGIAQYQLGMHAESAASAEEAVALCHALRDPRALSHALKILAQAREALGDLIAADRARTDVLRLLEGAHDPTSVRIRMALRTSTRSAHNVDDSAVTSRSSPGKPLPAAHDNLAASRSPSLSPSRLYTPPRRRRR